MQGKNPTRKSKFDRRVAAMASKYTLEYCEKVLKANPEGATNLLAYVLNGSGLDSDKMAAKFSAGPAHPKGILSPGPIRINRRVVWCQNGVQYVAGLWQK